MALREYDAVIRLWVVAAIAAGVVFVTVGGSTLGTAGVVLIIVGLMSLMIVVRNGLTGRDQTDPVP